MKQAKNIFIVFLLLAAGSLFRCYMSGDSGGGDGTENPPVNPGGTPTVTVEITGAITKSLTVPIVNTSYNNEYDLWIGDDPRFEVRFKWSGTPESNASYTSGVDEKVLVVDGDRRWEYFLSYTVKLTSVKPASGTITGTVEEQDAYCCDKEKGETKPINITISFSGI